MGNTLTVFKLSCIQIYGQLSAAQSSKTEDIALYELLAHVVSLG